ncbi:amino acid synthesis family protein [Reyranella sp. CPCC 100927]|uniref:amino acid synthesis family protein n=1 Tax=Reyranella sp. CPCC 100927 TaxID=2599616 RepID=UPI0011B37C0B|nr:amino acid synthesis family protein [Reyranella sp. CPCC 100927]TWS93652.1 amino acid synthesis family protein [Reyranella sp. CPCC 100927]
MSLSTSLSIRKICAFQEDVREDQRVLAQPFKHVIVAAVIRNPWAGRGFVEDLKPVVGEIAPQLGQLLATHAVGIMGGADKVQAFGKAAAVGLGGDYEHANALIHTVLFGDPCRQAINGSAWMVGNQKVAPTGLTLELPMAHKDDAKNQNYYHTIPIFIPDAPRADEIVVAVGMASGTRPNARL